MIDKGCLGPGSVPKEPEDTGPTAGWSGLLLNPGARLLATVSGEKMEPTLAAFWFLVEGPRDKLG